MDFLVPVWIAHISQFSNNPDIIVVFKGPEGMCGRLPAGFSIGFVGRQAINALKLAIPVQSLVFQGNVKNLFLWNCLEISLVRYKDVHALFEIINFKNNLKPAPKDDLKNCVIFSINMRKNPSKNSKKLYFVTYRNTDTAVSEGLK